MSNAVPFTSDKTADSDFTCQRSSCGRLVLAGEPIFWFRNPDSQKWKKVCSRCSEYYQQKIETAQNVTTRHDTQSMPPPALPSRPNPAEIARKVNAAQRHDAPGSVMHITPLGFQVPQSRSYGQRQGHSLDQLPLHNLPAGSIPHPHFSTTGYTPSHGQYQAQVDHWRGRAYAPSGENVNVNISVAYLRPGGSREVVLPTLTDTIQFTRGTMFTFNLSNPTALNLRDISAKMNVDMDRPTLDQHSAYFYPSCIKTNKKTSQRHFVKPATPFKVMLVISSEEWQKWETAYESNEDANDLVNPPSQQQSFGPKTTHSFRAPSYTAQETHLSLAPSAANQPEQNNENALPNTTGRNMARTEGSSSAKRTRSESMVVTPPQAKKSLTWSSPTRDQYSTLRVLCWHP
ncbi:hypothetical protein GYMLUDRAFT_249702 [Collybiopsis luxurians FD-317 M1]|uniref:Stc1 domain-containing protein n=1 Tax=Collybiopsis luxurians FD-317 M1 TaxID=944289 RepID=A0A0D0BWX3_9AGAR|nr:hypothetical protein GYMLUDRAFT_249702 [Collybiopsis luxurians FD-317 M1]